MNRTEKRDAITSKLGEVLIGDIDDADMRDIVATMAKMTAFLIGKICKDNLPGQLMMADGVAKIIKQMLLRNEPPPLQ